jgi:hypothetical protein
MQDISESKSPLRRISYTPVEAAAGRTRTRIFRAIKDGEMVARKDGRATLIEDTELQRWVRSLSMVGRKADEPVAARRCQPRSTTPSG